MLTTKQKIILILLILIICFSYLCFLKTEQFTSTNKLSSLKVSLCIPCIPRDKEKLLRLMESVSNQTLKPMDVVISLSGEKYTNDSFKNKLEKIATVPVKIIYSNDEKNASENRNIASKNAYGDIISYIDADDIMNKNRIERIVEIFKEYDSNAVLHSFESTLDINSISKYDKRIYKGKYMYKLSKEAKTPFLHIHNENTIHHGHISIKKSVFNNIQFNTSQEYKRGQDSKFVRDIIDFYGNNDKTVIFTNEKLSYYIPAKYQTNKTTTNTT